MQRIDFLKQVRRIERHWDCEIDRDRWWPHLKDSPGPIVVWKINTLIGRNSHKPPTLPQVACTSFELEQLPKRLQVWWRENHYHTWPKIGLVFTSPNHIHRWQRVTLRKHGTRNSWRPWTSISGKN